MKKLEQIERQEQKTREKIAALQDILKDIGKQRTEQEDLQIIQKFRALKLSRDELYLLNHHAAACVNPYMACTPCVKCALKEYQVTGSNFFRGNSDSMVI